MANDRIQEQRMLPAPRSRVWRAIGDAAEFGRWFRVDLEGQQWEAGHHTRGHVTFPGYEHLVFDALVERVAPGHLLAFRWHPHPVDPAADYSGEEPTLVTFELEDAPAGTLLTVAESGFGRLPAARRAQAYEGNVAGWRAQMENLRQHLAP